MQHIHYLPICICMFKFHCLVAYHELCAESWLACLKSIPWMRLSDFKYHLIILLFENHLHHCAILKLNTYTWSLLRSPKIIYSLLAFLDSLLSIPPLRLHTELSSVPIIHFWIATCYSSSSALIILMATLFPYLSYILHHPEATLTPLFWRCSSNVSIVIFILP